MFGLWESAKQKPTWRQMDWEGHSPHNSFGLTAHLLRALHLQTSIVLPLLPLACFRLTSSPSHLLLYEYAWRAGVWAEAHVKGKRTIFGSWLSSFTQGRNSLGLLTGPGKPGFILRASPSREGGHTVYGLSLLQHGLKDPMLALNLLHS